MTDQSRTSLGGAAGNRADAGLSGERTALSWGRTSAVAVFNAALLVRAGSDTGDPSLLWAAALLVVLTAVLWGNRRHRYASALRRSGPPVRRLRLVAALVTACGLLVLGGLLVGSPSG